MKLRLTIVELWSCFKALIVSSHLMCAILFSYWHDLKDLRIYMISSVILIVVFIIDFIFVKRFKLQFNPPIILYTCCFLWASITLLIEPTLAENYDTLISFAKTVIVTISCSCLISRKLEILIVLTGIALAVILLFFVNYEQIIYSQHIIRTAEKVKDLGKARLSGTISNANQFGMTAIIGIWALLLLWFTKVYWFRCLILLSTIPTFAIINLSGSRKVMLVLPILFVMFIWFNYLKGPSKGFLMKKMLIYCLSTIFICLFIIYIINYTPFGFRLLNNIQGNFSSTSDNERINFVRAAILMFFESPLWGKGFDNFRYIGINYGCKPNSYSHSTVLSLIANTGMLGFMLYFGSVLALFVHSWKLLNDRLTKNDRYIIAGTLSLIVVNVLFNMFAVMYAAKVIWPLLGCLSGYIYYSRKSDTFIKESIKGEC